MIADQPPRPANIRNIVAINQGRIPLSLAEPVCSRVEAGQAWEWIRRDHHVLDTRTSQAFGAGHIPGALNIHLSSGEFEQRAGWMLPPEGDVVMVVDAGEAAQLAVHKLAFVGLDRRIAGYVEMPAWNESRLPTASLAQISVAELSRRLSERDIRVLDVRESAEWRGGHIASAVHLNFKHLPERLGELPIAPDEPLAVVCASGMRSSTACSFLLRAGFKRLLNVTGGMSAWQEAGCPVTP